MSNFILGPSTQCLALKPVLTYFSSMYKVMCVKATEFCPTFFCFRTISGEDLKSSNKYDSLVHYTSYILT